MCPKGWTPLQAEAMGEVLAHLRYMWRRLLAQGARYVEASRPDWRPEFTIPEDSAAR